MKRQSKLISVRVSPVIVEVLEQRASASGMPLAVYCRQLLERHATTPQETNG